MPQHRPAGLHTGEEVVHPLLQPLAIPRHIAALMDLVQAHAHLIVQAPEPGQQDAPRAQIIPAVVPLHHDR